MSNYDLFDEDEPDDIDDCSSGVGWGFCDKCKRYDEHLREMHDYDFQWLCEKCIDNVEDEVKSEKGLFDEE